MKQVVSEKSAQSEVLDFDDALTLTGYGKFNFLVLLAAGGCLMAVFMETMGMMFIIPAATCDLQLDLTSKGILSSSTYFGVFASSLIWGFIADTKGRKNVIMITSYISFVMTFFSSFVSKIWLFILLRFLNGVFIGGSSAVVFAYIGEFHNNSFRPKIISWMSIFIALANMFLPGLAWLTLPSQWAYPIKELGINYRPWRLLLILYGMSSVIFGSMLLFLPESPKYLLSQNRNAEALAVIEKMYRWNTGKDDFHVKDLKLDEEPRNVIYGVFRTIWEQIAPLFRRQFVWKTLMVCTLQFGVFFSTNGFSMWYPDILNKMALLMHAEDDEVSVSMCSAFVDVSEAVNSTRLTAEEYHEHCVDKIDTTVFVSNLSVSFIYAVIYLVVGFLINVLGQKNMMYGFLLACTCAGIVAQEISGYILYQVFVTMFLCCTACISITNTMVVDLFPTQYRAMAFSISLMMGRFGAVVGSQTHGWILHSFCEFLFFIFALDHLVLLIIVFLLPIASKKSNMIEPIT